MTTVTASRRDTPAVALAAVTAFGLLLGWATYTLHGTTPLLERATNSVSTWIVWTALPVRSSAPGGSPCGAAA
ncbi:hypothetical protein ACOZE1_09080 [Streptomyces cellulosae]|uniref:hypothetical protein n=1 Tax=Streptomyces sp. UNC401CLCol TaxID=1449077 RepID=UPI000B1B4785